MHAPNVLRTWPCKGPRLLMWKVTRAVTVDFGEKDGVWYWTGPRYVVAKQDGPGD